MNLMMRRVSLFLRKLAVFAVKERRGSRILTIKLRRIWKRLLKRKMKKKILMKMRRNSLLIVTLRRITKVKRS